MFQEIEGQRPVVVSRNHMDRPRSRLYRWVKPDDWSPTWNYQRSLMAGGVYAGLSSAYYQVHTPCTELLKFYQSPNNFAQLRIFIREIFKMDSFKRGFGSSLAFNSLYGLSFEASRIYLWKDFLGGYPNEPDIVDHSWFKKLATSLLVGLSTCWIPVPFNNVQIRYQQDQILPPEHARGYKNHFHAAYSIATKDGFFPFFRGGLPIMAEKTIQTMCLFFYLDFIKEKCHHIQHYGTDLGGFSDNSMRLIYTSLGVYLGVLHGYPILTLGKMVEQLPLNSKGERFFNNYSEAAWKALGENFNVYSLWHGFHRYLLKVGPPMFLTMWFADVMGLFDILYLEGYVVPAS
ncbi:hypothetical protein SteCoe_11031 [Stentor coeruleus]|uniref:Uncharacterized protein n=1 Tax=Stentor coeruleus TaxID=5963 RepID=A0A1R2CE22_9CILI|nr:hypothetical protein SteCoe_11031 [Stentor coeruleus]